MPDQNFMPYVFTGYHGPELTATTQSLAEPPEVSRLRLLVKTKDEIIQALRRQLACSEELLQIYQSIYGNGEGDFE